jgi:hypothetical protein
LNRGSSARPPLDSIHRKHTDYKRLAQPAAETAIANEAEALKVTLAAKPRIVHMCHGIDLSDGAGGEWRSLPAPSFEEGAASTSAG